MTGGIGGAAGTKFCFDGCGSAKRGRAEAAAGERLFKGGGGEVVKKEREKQQKRRKGEYNTNPRKPCLPASGTLCAKIQPKGEKWGGRSVERKKEQPRGENPIRQINTRRENPHRLDRGMKGNLMWEKNAAPPDKNTSLGLYKKTASQIPSAVRGGKKNPPPQERNMRRSPSRHLGA